MTDVSVVIPTYRRPALLEQAIRSVAAQQLAERRFEIVVIDNDPAGSAAPVIAALAGASAAPIRHIVEPRAGISFARNAGIRAAAGRHLAFLDDDEQVGLDWLGALIAAVERHGADAAVGPVLPRFPADATIDAFCRRFYTRDAGVPTGTPLLRWNIGNSLFVKERCFDAPEPFDPRLGLSGGEDTVFLRALTRSGRRMVWCAEAPAWESIPADRIAPSYLLRRAFRGGQTTSFTCLAVRPPEPGRALRHIAVGGGQFLLFGPAALALRLLRRPAWLGVAAKALAGLGKVLCHPGLHMRLYRRAPGAGERTPPRLSPLRPRHGRSGPVS